MFSKGKAWFLTEYKIGGLAGYTADGWICHAEMVYALKGRENFSPGLVEAKRCKSLGD